MKTFRSFGLLSAFVVVALSWGRADAGILSAIPSGPVSGVTLTPGDPVNFIDFAAMGNSAILKETVNGFSPAVGLSFTYNNAADFTSVGGPADRLIKVMTNNTGLTINAISFAVTGATFVEPTGTFTPSEGNFVVGSPDSYKSVQGVTTFTPTLLTFLLTAPLAPGAGTAFYLPVYISPNGGSFTMTETFTAATTPEPSAMALGLMGGIGALGLVRRRRLLPA